MAGVDHDAHLGHARPQLQVFFGRRWNDDCQLVLLRFVAFGKRFTAPLGFAPILRTSTTSR